MPNLSTHINFLRILKNKNFNKYDINYLALGSIAPDYYVIFNDKDKECFSHFKSNIKDKCDFKKFSSFFSDKNLNYAEYSYILGYCLHLWLDNYFYNRNSKLYSYQSIKFGEFRSHLIIEENIKNYDIKSIIEFISKINIIKSSFNDILPVKLNKSINIWNDFKHKCINRNFNLTCPILLNKDDYSKFLDESSDIFLNEYYTYMNKKNN